MLAKEVKATFAVRLDQLLQEQPPEQTREYPHRQKEVAAARMIIIEVLAPGCEPRHRETLEGIDSS